MVLDPLIQLIETLADRINQHRQALSQSEALTRYVLIDPLLRVLGWDTEDPGQVQPEYTAGGERVDYALLEQGKPQVLVEAKKLGSLLSAALEQNIGYCIRTGAPYLVNTDGQRWEIYDIYKQGPIDQKRVVTFDIATTDQNKVAAAALFLWRGNYRQVVMPAPTEKPQEPLPPPPPPPSGPNLASFEPQKHSKPPTIIAPDGSALSSPTWTGLTVDIVRWLYEKGKLSKVHCPVPWRRSKMYYFVHTEPKHANGKDFGNPKQVGPLWVEARVSSRDTVVNARFLLSRVGEDPALWKVRQ